MTRPTPADPPRDDGGYQELKLLLPNDLCRAWQRCSWLIVNESDTTRLEIMEEMVRDFLCKHGC
jgi:hypothetical protein